MNYLQLAQRLRQEAGVSGTGPLTVVNQSGEMRRLVDWINSAWLDIQRLHASWDWMLAETTFLTVAGQGSYTPVQAGIASRFGRWSIASFRVARTPPNDETMLMPLSYGDFRSVYLTGPQPQARPVVVCSLPSLSLGLGYKPDQAYTIRGEYWKSAQNLTADSDIPEMPEDYHDAIVYRALMLYARYESAAEIYEDALQNYRRLISLLEIHQLPSFDGTEPLA
jgi:hypothetical protein